MERFCENSKQLEAVEKLYRRFSTEFQIRLCQGILRKSYGILKITRKKIVVESLKPANLENRSLVNFYIEIFGNFFQNTSCDLPKTYSRKSGSLICASNTSYFQTWREIKGCRSSSLQVPQRITVQKNYSKFTRKHLQ